MVSEMKKTKGFTIIELLLVIATLSILAVVAFESYAGYEDLGNPDKKAISLSASQIGKMAPGMEIFSHNCRARSADIHGFMPCEASLVGTENTFTVQQKVLLWCPGENADPSADICQTPAARKKALQG